MEIFDEAKTLGGDHKFLFPGRNGDTPLNRSAMANALRGTWRIKDGRKVFKTPGLCELLGIAKFTPHDLRRSAATLCGEMGLPVSGISLCLDHQSKGRERQAAACGRAQGLQSGHAHHHDQEAQGARCLGRRASADHRRDREDHRVRSAAARGLIPDIGQLVRFERPG
jgi:integrase